jgi:hypothetical protein
MCQLEGAAGNGFETEVNGGGTNLALRKLVYLLPLEGVRGEELVTYSNVINIGLPIGEGLGGSLGLVSDCKVTTLFLLYKNFACFFCVKQFEIFVINQ